jgi:hypothetical protein
MIEKVWHINPDALAKDNPKEKKFFFNPVKPVRRAWDFVSEANVAKLHKAISTCKAAALVPSIKEDPAEQYVMSLEDLGILPAFLKKLHTLVADEVAKRYPEADGVSIDQMYATKWLPAASEDHHAEGAECPLVAMVFTSARGKEFTGGEIVFRNILDDDGNRLVVWPKAGEVLIFPGNSLFAHRVARVEDGVRTALIGHFR